MRPAESNMASRVELNRVKKKIRSDKRFKQMKSVLELNRDRIKTEAWRKEMKLNHQERSVGKLKVKDPNFFKKMAKACAFEVAARSRLAEMAVVCSDIERALDSHLKHFSDYVMLTYSADLKLFSTIKERTKLIDSILRPFNEYLDDISSLKTQIYIYIEDIDKTGYAVKNMVSVFEVVIRNEGRVNMK